MGINFSGPSFRTPLFYVHFQQSQKTPKLPPKYTQVVCLRGTLALPLCPTQDVFVVIFFKSDGIMMFSPCPKRQEQTPSFAFIHSSFHSHSVLQEALLDCILCQAWAGCWGDEMG